MNHKRIIVDFDDTLAFTTNRDWKNAKPNLPLIDKLNKLFFQGWIIDIFTARGSISCKTRKEADAKYRPDIEEWLKTHNVRYNMLSFDKPLGSYYIDDKSITPDDFVKLNITPLKGGLSGSELYTDGKFVHKTDKNCHHVNKWYSKAKTACNTPKIYRIVGDIITMEYINHDDMFFVKRPEKSLDLICDALTKLKSVECNNDYGFDTYIKRINDHIALSKKSHLYEITDYLHKNVQLNASFSHGDFGVANCLFSNGKLVLIDPIVNMFGCTELDSAKFVASLYINEYGDEYVNLSFTKLSEYINLSEIDFRYLIAAEVVRVYKYHPNKNFILECIDRVLKQK